MDFHFSEVFHKRTGKFENPLNTYNMRRCLFHMSQHHILLSLWFENKSGVLNRISSLFQSVGLILIRSMSDELKTQMSLTHDHCR